MPIRPEADQVVIMGYLVDEITRGGLVGTVESKPMPLGDQAPLPMLLDAVGHMHIQTRTRTATPDPVTGFWAVLALSTNDPDLDAYGGRQITLPSQTPKLVEVPYNAPTTPMTQAMVDQINPTNAADLPKLGDAVRARWFHQLAGFTAPTPANAYLTSSQTTELIASAIAGVGGGSGSGDLPEYSASAQTAAVTASGLVGKTTRFNTTSSAIAQPLPPATAGAQVAVGWDAGTNALTLTAAGSDVIGSGSATSVPVPVVNAVIQLHCTTAGRWRVVGGHLPSSYVVFNSANTDVSGAAAGSVSALRKEQAGGYTLIPAASDRDARDVEVKKASVLRPWWTSLANRDAAPARIYCAGDSLTEGYGITYSQRWVNLLADRLRQRFPSAGIGTGGGFGYLPIVHANLSGPSDKTEAVVTGTTSINYAWGLGGRSRQMNPGSTATFAFTGTGCDILYYAGPTVQSFTWAVDGGSATTVNANSGSALDASVATGPRGLSAGSHTLVISLASGNFAFMEGLLVYNGDDAKGIQVIDAGHGGWTSSDFLTRTTGYRGISTLGCSLATLCLGANDLAVNSAATVKADLVTLIAAMRSYSPNVPVVLIPIFERGGSQVEPWANYVQAMHEIADADSRAIVFDLYRRLPRYDSEPNMVQGDLVHPTVKGHSFIADQIAGFLSPN